MNGYIIALVIWAFLGGFVALCMIDWLGRQKLSKKQVIFLYLVYGPFAWILGLIVLLCETVAWIWKALG